MNWNVIKEEIKGRIKGDLFWKKHLDFDNKRTSRPNFHLAVFVEPYLGAIFEGKKTVESRFSINRIDPYKKVYHGDVILLKKSGGPVLGMAVVSSTWYYELDKPKLNQIKNIFSDKLYIKSQSFWNSKSKSCYASLLQIEEVLKFEPFNVDKKDRRGWVILYDSKVMVEK